MQVDGWLDLGAGAVPVVADPRRARTSRPKVTFQEDQDDSSRPIRWVVIASIAPADPADHRPNLGQMALVVPVPAAEHVKARGHKTRQHDL
jgi:hypothetical protein